MGRPRNPFPIPALRQRGKSYQVRWRDGENRYAATVGPVAAEVAKALCALAAAALTGKNPWPPELENNLEVRRYLRDKEGTVAPADLSNVQLVDRYLVHMRAKSTANTPVGADWAHCVRSYLARWLEYVGTPEDATPAKTLHWLENLTRRAPKKGKGTKGQRVETAMPVTNATKNRARAAVMGFAKWLRTTRRVGDNYNPMRGIPSFREVRPPDMITVWDAPQVPTLLKIADQQPDGIAVWLGVHAGMRLAEIARAKWVHIGPAYIGIYTSKNTLSRQIPVSTALLNRLAREPRINARIVGMWPEAFWGWNEVAKKFVKARFPKAFPPPEGVAYPPNQYGWNTFRHTFASRHVQAGVPLDVVANWIGDTIQTCRKHYARFVPRDHRDIRVDLADAKPSPQRQTRRSDKKKGVRKGRPSSRGRRSNIPNGRHLVTGG